MSDLTDKKNDRDSTSEEHEPKKKKVWIPKKEGGFKSVMRTVKPRPTEAETEEDFQYERTTRRPVRQDFGDFKRYPDKERKEIKKKIVEREIPEEPVELPEIKALYTLGMQRSNPQRMMQVLADTKITVLIDVRSETAMHAPGFVKARDLAILLKESVNIEYRREEILIPGRDCLIQFERDNNWMRFKSTYLKQLERRKVAEVFNRTLFVTHKVVLLGERRDADKDPRGILAQYLEENWEITAVHHLQ